MESTSTSTSFLAKSAFTFAFFVLPFILVSLYWLLERIFTQNLFFKLSAAFFLVCLITSALYFSYPRYDSFFNSRGYSVSETDIAAVNWINGASQKDYIVLANQQVSAAALKQFGFKKYYSTADGNELFYYPIPTSSLLYQYYLDMVYKKPNQKTMSAAMTLAGVNEGYFILNKYWFAFPKILDEAKYSADSWTEFGAGQVYVFKYGKK